MTVRDATVWCESCSQSCFHHPTRCTVCGSELVPIPASANAEDRPRFSHHTGVSPVPDFLAQETRAAARELRNLLRGLRQQIQEVGNEQQLLLSELQRTRHEWENNSEPSFDPQTTTSTTSHPTSKSYLDSLPRTIVSENSFLIFQTTIKIEGLPETEAFGWVPGCFNDDDFSMSGNLASHGILGEATQAEEAITSESHIFFSEWNDKLNFVRMTRLAQKAGFSSCLIANRSTQSYWQLEKSIQEDSSSGNLKIPLFIVTGPDADAVLRLNATGARYARLGVSRHPQQCVVCAEYYGMGDSVILLPECNHVFHTTCLLQWLNIHHSCPTCRHELPSDDDGCG